MLPDKSTSDEKLLKIIEGTAAKRSQKVGVKPKDKKAAPFKFKFKIKPNLYTLNKGVFMVCGILTLFFVYGLINETKIINAELFLPPAKMEVASSALLIQDNAGFLGLGEYTGEITQRNMFLPPELRSGWKAGKKETAKPSPAELLKDFTVVGIIWSKNPEAMIESKREARTFLLKKGDLFGQDEFKVKEVTRSSIIVEVDIEGELTEYELR